VEFVIPIRICAVLAAVSLIAQPLNRPDELLTRWNHFALNANAYATGLGHGVKDMRMRARLVKDWDALIRCECW
jgi:hypothetical protein